MLKILITSRLQISFRCDLYTFNKRKWAVESFHVCIQNFSLKFVSLYVRCMLFKENIHVNQETVWYVIDNIFF